MEHYDIDLLKQGKYTKCYIQLVNTLNTKIETKIDALSNKILEEFENKKRELLKMKNELDELYKMRSEINNMNAFYDNNINPSKMSSASIKEIPFVPIENPYKSGKNLLTELSNINISIINGELIKKCYKSNSLELCKAEEIKQSDQILSNFSRFVLKKNNSIKPLDNNKVLLESKKLTMVIDFNENKVNPSHIFLRYFFLQNENKYSYSYVSNVLVSNDNENWETISQVNTNDLKVFERLPVFKWNVLNNKPDNYYRYFALEVSPFKDILNANQINKYVNKLHIPLCGIEMYGEYKTNITVSNLDKLDENFEDFFNNYLQVNQVELDKVELQVLVRIILDSFKELNNLITNIKSQLLVKEILSNTRKTLEAERNTETLELNKEKEILNLENMVNEIVVAEKEEEEKYLREVSKELNDLNNIKNDVEEECYRECLNLTNNENIKKLLDEDDLLDINLSNKDEEIKIEINQKIKTNNDENKPKNNFLKNKKKNR